MESRRISKRKLCVVLVFIAALLAAVLWNTVPRYDKIDNEISIDNIVGVSVRTMPPSDVSLGKENTEEFIKLFNGLKLTESTMTSTDKNGTMYIFDVKQRGGAIDTIKYFDCLITVNDKSYYKVPSSDDVKLGDFCQKIAN